MGKKKTSYEDKIERIWGNKLEYNGEHQKAIAEVKTWLCCEWQCGMIDDMHDYTKLLNKVDVIAEKMIKEL